MSNISGQLIKDSYNYVLQSDLITGIVYRIGGQIPENPKFISGLTVNASFTYSDGSEFDGYVLTCDASGNATWGPVSGATSGVVVTGGTFNYSAGTLDLRFSNGSGVSIPGLKDVYVTGGTVSGDSIVFSYNDTTTFQVSGITSFDTFTSYTASTEIILSNKVDLSIFDQFAQDTNISLNNKLEISSFTAYTATTQPLILNAITGGTYSGGTLYLKTNSGSTIQITGFTTGGTSSISGDYLPLSGGTVTGGTLFQSGLTANTISATTYYNLPISGLTEGNGIQITNDGNGNFTITSTATTSNVVQGITGITGTSGVSAITTNYGTTIINTQPDQTVTLTGGTNIQIVGTYPNFGVNFTGSTSGGTVSGDYLPLSGGTVTGGTIFQSGLTANTISATTYLNLPKDVFVTGGTYSNGSATFINNTGGTFNVIGFPTATGTTTNYYGSFSDTNNQNVNGANTPTAWSANTTELSNGIYIVDGSKITVSNDGIYEIGYSAQIEKTQGTAAPVTIWAKINGLDIDRSSSTITLENNSVYALPFVSYILDLYAGNYVEFYFSSPSEHVRITTLSGLTSPTRPVSPSLILVAKAIGNAVLSNSGDSYVTGFTLTNDNLSLTQNRVGQYSGFTVNLPYLNTTGGTINGDLNVTGSTSAATYYGYGGYLTGISRGGGGGARGQLYYFNISNTQSPYYEFSTTATSVSEQTISATTGASQTAYVGGFMTPIGLPGITDFPAGILSFYLHCYDGNNHNFNVYCELYKRTTGGTETLLFTSDPVAVAGSTTEMVITDGFFSGTSLNITDRLVVKIYATNISNQTRTIYFVSEGSQHYSFGLTTIPTFTDSYVTGFSLNNDTITLSQNRTDQYSAFTISLSAYTGNTSVSGDYLPLSGGTVTGGTIFQSGLTANTISATTYQNLPISGLTEGSNISITGSNGNFTVSFTGTTGSDFTGNTSASCVNDFYVSNIFGCSGITTLQTSIQTVGSTVNGTLSHAEGFGTSVGTVLAYSGTVLDGLITLDSSYGDLTFEFISGDYLFLDDSQFDSNYGKAKYIINTCNFTTQTEIQLTDTSITSTTVYVVSTTNPTSWAGDKIIYTDYSHAEGNTNVAYGNYSHSEGRESISFGNYSHSEGYNGKAIGSFSHAEGRNSLSIGNYSHAEGFLTQSIGLYSHAEGIETQARGDYSHAEGNLTQARGDYSHAEGRGTFSYGIYSHSEGSVTNAIGDYSHSEGFETDSIGNYSHTMGRSTEAYRDYQLAIGEYNTTGNTDSLFVIGNGTNVSTRSDLALFNSDSIIFNAPLTATSISATTYLNLPSTSSFTGGTVSGPTNFTSGLTANTVSATTYQNLPLSITSVTESQNVITVVNSNGSSTNSTIDAVTGGTYAAGQITLSGTGSVNGTQISTKILPVVLTAISNTASTDASLSSTFTLTLTGNTTLATPTNGFSGQRILYQLKQDGSGSKTLTLSSGFRSGPITVTLSTAANTTDYLGVIYNSIDNKWDVLALNKGYS